MFCPLLLKNSVEELWGETNFSMPVKAEEWKLKMVTDRRSVFQAWSLRREPEGIGRVGA